MRISDWSSDVCSSDLRGQILVELDPADAEVGAASAQAELARSVRSVRGLFSKSGGLQAKMRSSEISLQAARGDIKRRLAVAADGGVSGEIGRATCRARVSH